MLIGYQVKMSNTTLLVAACALLLSFIAHGKSSQSPQRPAAPAGSPPLAQNAPSDDEEVVRITTNLVQVDAVVTDAEGRVVTDLRAEDFEVLEDGRPQTITNLSFVSLEPAGAAGAARSRNGSYSLPDAEVAPAMRGGDRQLFAALASPVGGGDVRVRLASFFGNERGAGSFVRSLPHINAQDITFTDEPNNFKKAVLDVAAVTSGDDGRTAAEFNRTHTVRVGPDTFRHIMLHGLSYSADVPVKRAGAYQLRVAVRDAASGRVGTNGQFV